MLKKDLKVALIVAICLLINCLLKNAFSMISAPFWLDSVGTAFAAYLLGPVCGAMVGIASNIAYGFFAPSSIYFAVTSACIGVTIGICAKKNMFKTVFDVVTAAIITTFVAAVISTPINCIFYHGLTSNEWGDGIFYLLRKWDMFFVAAAFIAEFFIDFTDKFVTLGMVYIAVKLYRKIRNKNNKDLREEVTEAVSILLALILSLSVMSPAVVKAESLAVAAADAQGNDYSTYIQTIYSNNNGLMSGEANDLAFTGDGVLWIGTYAGLYRYTGSDFKYMKDFESVKNVNCLYVDEEGRLWIGTNDDGLSLCIEDRIINTFNEDDGFPSNSVRSIVQQSSGNYFVGTSDSLVMVSLAGGAHALKTFDNITYAMDLDADDNDNIVAVTYTGEMYLINGDRVITSISKDNTVFTCCEFDKEGNLYAGTDNGSIVVYKIDEKGFTELETIDTQSKSYINCIELIETGDMFICLDNGIAWIDLNKEMRFINPGSFNSSIDNVAVDYQGNIWFSSSRLGIMKLCSSAFTELYKETGLEENVVNAVVEWGENLYFGTDSGLDIINKDTEEIVTNELTEYLDNKRIRCLMTDSSDNLWICAYNEGVVCVSKDGSHVTYTADEGATGNKFRSALELRDKTIAVSSDKGITFIKDGKVTGTITQNDGLSNGLVLCLYEDKDGKIYAGTDGGGIAIIENGKIVNTLTRKNGLSSGVILRLVEDKDSDNCIFVVTSNGICYIDADGSARELTKFPYSNNYDIYDNGEGELFVPGSAGIYKVNKQDLIKGKTLRYQLYNYRNGLRGAFTANAWSYIDSNGYWYIPGDSGVTKYDLKNDRDKFTNSYRMIISSVKMDGTEHSFQGEKTIVLTRGISHLQLTPEVINYSATEPYVSYYLEGVDSDKIVLLQSELGPVDYTNLPAGTYRFHLEILDSNKETVVEEQIYTIVKEAEIYDHIWFVLYFVAELICIVAWFTWFITKKVTMKNLSIKEKEIQLAKQQIQMGNETIIAIARTVDAKDSNTSLHSTRVSEYSVLIAKKLGYSEEDQENLRKAALLHDIGKIGIPDSVLNKPSRLDDEEYKIMKSHVQRGAEILKDFSLVPNVVYGALYHHERYDGKGYMAGLKGKEIPEMARIIGIADAFDAMTANRVYRKKLDFDYVLSEIKKGRGTQFDPEITDIFLGLLEEGKIDVEALYKKEGEE